MVSEQTCALKTNRSKYSSNLNYSGSAQNQTECGQKCSTWSFMEQIPHTSQYSPFGARFTSSWQYYDGLIYKPHSDCLKSRRVWPSGQWSCLSGQSYTLLFASQPHCSKSKMPSRIIFFLQFLCKIQHTTGFLKGLIQRVIYWFHIELQVVRGAWQATEPHSTWHFLF